MWLSKLMVRSIIVLFCGAILLGCGSDGFTVNAHFNNSNDLVEGTKVYFENKVIGEVLKVETGETGSNATLKLDEQAVVQVGANAAVVVNRLKQGAPLEIYNRANSSDESLQDGQTIKSFESMFALGAWMVGDAIQIGSGTASKYIESFQDYLQSDKFDQDKEVVKQEFNSYKESAKNAMQQLEEDMQIAAREFELTEESAAQAVEQLGKELAPMVREITGESAQLMAEIEKFAQRLEQSSPARRQAGQRLIESMIATLESFNRALEEGSNQDPATSAESEY